MSQPDPTLTVAQDLRAIVELSADLHDQAIAKATHHLMPGGDAMVLLAPVASPQRWQNRVDTIERMWWDDDEATERPEDLAAEEDSAEHIVWTIRYWSEDWRLQHDVPEDHPTLVSEAQWLAGVLEWAWAHEVHWDDFAKDIATARRRLEAVLYAGERDEHGVAKCECGGDLDRQADERRDCRCKFRPLAHARHVPDRCCVQCWKDARHATHNQGGLRDEWVCRLCFRLYGPDEYKQRIAKDSRDNATRLTMDMMCERFPDMTPGNLRVLAHRGKVHKRGLDELGRVLYDVSDVERHMSERLLAG